jgi:ssDNA thymidine ADP-ribosyltransferase, DarT
MVYKAVEGPIGDIKRMSDVSKIAKILLEKGWSFYHFTDIRNLPTIRLHGLLSMRALRERSIIVAPGGNDWSLDADRRSGMDDYVHLCFFKEHPMEYVAKKDGRIGDSRFLKIVPSVIEIPGVMITDKVANRSDAWPRPAEVMVGKLDLEVIYTRTDWKDAKIQERLRAARLCEILVPKSVPLELIRNVG